MDEKTKGVKYFGFASYPSATVAPGCFFGGTPHLHPASAPAVPAQGWLFGSTAGAFAGQPPVQRVVAHGEFEVVVLTDAEGRFIGISELRQRKSFLSPAQLRALPSYRDVEDLYRE